MSTLSNKSGPSGFPFYLAVLFIWIVIGLNPHSAVSQVTPNDIYQLKLNAPTNPFKLAFDQANNRYLVLMADSFFTLNRDQKGWQKNRYMFNGFDHDLDFRDLLVLSSNTRLLLVLQSGGYVYEMVHDSIKKLDKCSNFKTQFYSTKFFSGDTIFSYGGYGHWVMQPFISYFDFKTGEWEMWEINGEEQLPKERSAHMGYFNPQTKDFYIMGGYTNRYKARLPRQDLKLFDVWKINLHNRIWQKLGKVNTELDGLYLNPLGVGDKVLCYDVDKDRIFHLLDLEKNTMSNYELNEKAPVDFYNKVPPAVNSKTNDLIYATLPYPYSKNGQHIVISPLSSLFSQPHTESTIYTTFWDQWWLPLLLITILLAGFLTLFSFPSRKSEPYQVDFFIRRGILKYGQIEIYLEQAEQECLKRMACEPRFHNLVELFSGLDLETTSMDLLYKNRRKLFSSINNKVSFITKGKTELFLTRKNPNDNRMVEVKLNEAFVRIQS